MRKAGKKGSQSTGREVEGEGKVTDKAVQKALEQAAAAEARARAAEQQVADLVQVVKQLQLRQDEMLEMMLDQRETLLRRGQRVRAESRESRSSNVHEAGPLMGDFVDELVNSRGASEGERHPMIVISDMGGEQGDAGDTVALMLLRGLEEIGRVSLRGLVVYGTQSDFESRLEIGQKLVKELGFRDCIVGGTPSQSTRHSAAPMHDEAIIQYEGGRVHATAEDVLAKVINSPDVDDFSLLIVCLCPTSSLADFIAKHGERASRKIKQVALLSAVNEYHQDALFSVRTWNPFSIPFQSHPNLTPIP